MSLLPFTFERGENHFLKMGVRMVTRRKLLSPCQYEHCCMSLPMPFGADLATGYFVFTCSEDRGDPRTTVI